MVRLLPILAVAGAAAAVLAAVVLVSPASAIVPLLTVAVAVILFLRRDATAAIAGAVLLVLGVIGLSASLALSIRSLDLTFGLGPGQAEALVITCGVAIPAALLLTSWSRRTAPAAAVTTPIAAIGLGAAALAVLLAFVWAGSLEDHMSWQAWTLAVLAAATAVPGIMLLRADEPAPASRRQTRAS